MPTDDLPYEPVARDRATERTRCEAEIPGYAEARREVPWQAVWAAYLKARRHD
jgi:hypothetical protein